jgi:hypothetical protein
VPRGRAHWYGRGPHGRGMALWWWRRMARRPPLSRAGAGGPPGRALLTRQCSAACRFFTVAHGFATRSNL